MSNSLALSCFVATDAKVRQDAAGRPRVVLRLGDRVRRRTAEGGWRQTVNWYSGILLGTQRQIATAEQWLKKGAQIFVTGELQFYETKEKTQRGRPMLSASVRIHHWEFLSLPRDGTEGRRHAQKDREALAQAEAQGEFDSENDVIW